MCAEAAALLEAAGGEAKVALVMGLARVDAEVARRLLADSGGFVRLAVRPEGRRR